jgi:Fe-S-cluster-containing hydrogenase component 2
MSLLFRVTPARCIGCGKCELACAFAHGRDGAPASPRINVIRRGPEQGTPIVCFQCEQAACVAACPSGALARHAATGAIEVDERRCLRCRACVVACPFGNIAWDGAGHTVHKCDLCHGEPRCVPFCPTGALAYTGSMGP